MAPLNSHPNCEGCPFRARGLGFVPGRGPLTAKVAMIGNCPQKTDTYTGMPFSGGAGLRLDIELAKASIPRSRVWVDNAVRCNMRVKGRDVAPAKAIAECYQRHWGHSLRELSNLEFVVGLGGEVNKFLAGSWCGDRAFGTLLEVELPTLTSV